MASHGKWEWEGVKGCKNIADHLGISVHRLRSCAYEYNLDTKSAIELAISRSSGEPKKLSAVQQVMNELGLCYTSAKVRLKTYGSVEAAISIPASNKYEYKGIKGLKHIAAAYGVTHQGLYKQVRSGLTIEEALKIRIGESVDLDQYLKLNNACANDANRSKISPLKKRSKTFDIAV